ncbi:MAG: cobalt transporter [Clostridia bacterium]|nr:cobalt transporter [Clostridia bacterium]
MRLYLLDTRLRKNEEGEPIAAAQKQLLLVTAEEFAEMAANSPHRRTLLRQLNQIRYSKAELYGSCILGTLRVPLKQRDGITGYLCFGFYIYESRLFLIGDPEQLVHLLGRLRETVFPVESTIFDLFCLLLNSLLDNDISFIQSCEDKLYELENQLLTGLPDPFYPLLVPYRRDLMALHSYYYQLLTLAITIRANTNQLLPEDDCTAFAHLADRIGRLQEHVDLLRDYTLQIREMYQTQIELTQTKAMNLLTVISAIFLPLTLMVGWYGMNFVHMPELRWQLGYPGVIALSVAIVAAEILYFRRRKLL